ncbi:hypothetical protein N330_00192, partial [Leptosomus discolor]
VTIISIVAFLTTLVASIIRVKGAPCRRPVITGATRHPRRLVKEGLGTHVLPIKAKHSIFSIPWVFELHEGKPRRVPRDPHGSQRPVVAEGSLQLALARARAQVPHV